MSDSYTHRLDPRTDANLTAAILAVGNLLGVSPIADSILEHLKDRIGDSLSPEERTNPFSVYSGDVLGRAAAYVKETFGIDQPANIHAAPQGLQARDVPIPSDSVFAVDGLGRNRFEQLTGGTTGSYARMIADTAMSSVAYSAMTTWNPSSGAEGLNQFNFGGTPFAASDVGLDLTTAKSLLGQGFTTPQVIAAGRDRIALGLSGQQSAENLAYIRRDSPAHIANLKNYRSDSLGDAAAYASASQAATQAETEGRPEEAAQYRRIMAEIEARQKAERERISAEASDPQIQTRMNQELDKIWNNNQSDAVKANLDPQTVLAMQQHPENPDVVRAYREAVAAALEADPGKESALKAVDDALAADRELHGKTLAENVETADQNAVMADSVDTEGDELGDIFGDLNKPAEPSAAGESATQPAAPAADQPAEAAQPEASPQEPAAQPLKPKIGSNGLVAGPN